MITARCTECTWHYESDARWLTQRIADVHRGVYGHHVIDITTRGETKP